MFDFLKKFRFAKTSEPSEATQTPPPVDEALAAAPVEVAPTPVSVPEPEPAPALEPSESLSEQKSEPDPISPSVSEPISEPVSVSEPAVQEPEPPVQEKKLSWAQRLKAGLSRTRSQIGGGLANLFGLRKIDEELLEELESTLLMADCGVEATTYLIEALRKRWKQDKLETADELKLALAQELKEMIRPLEVPLKVEGGRPFIIMLAGINGAGKTTSIGKLAKYFQSKGLSVLLAAGDTFRAAAREQLETWGERNGVTVIAQEGGDSAAIIFDAIHAAKARGIDVVLADTAGRLPTQLHLMEEIAKVRRVIAKAEPSGPHEVLLVLDANIGQNALTQVKAFDSAIQVSGLVLTKLDGTAKGGIVAAIARQCPKPLRFIGVGEGIDDLQPFNVDEFVNALFDIETR